MSSIDWDEDPSSVPRIPIPVLRVPTGKTVFVRLIGPGRGVWVHWIEPEDERRKGRSKPHYRENCPHCPLQLFWWRYAPALLWKQTSEGNKWVPIVCPLSDENVRRLKKYAAGKPAESFVLQLQHRKAKPSDRGEVVLTIVEERPNDPLPPAFDVTPILLRLWNINRLDPSYREATGGSSAAFPDAVEDQVIVNLPPPAIAGKPEASAPPGPGRPAGRHQAHTNGAAEIPSMGDAFRELVARLEAAKAEAGTNGTHPETQANGTAAEPAAKPKRRKPRR